MDDDDDVTSVKSSAGGASTFEKLLNKDNNRLSRM